MPSLRRFLYCATLALQHEEIAEGIATWNIPGFQANRDLVAYPDGGLYNPVALTFDPSFNSQDFSKPIKHFKYPVLDDVKRPESNDDLAFMKVRRRHPPVLSALQTGIIFFHSV
jgi:hypothetical protein